MQDLYNNLLTDSKKSLEYIKHKNEFENNLYQIKHYYGIAVSLHQVFKMQFRRLVGRIVLLH
jgi:hypothetical protein